MTNRFVFVGLLTQVLAVGCGIPDPDQILESGQATFTVEDQAAWIETLGSDEFEGRGPSSPGEAKTIAYLELRTCALTETCNDSPDITMTRKGQLDCVDEATNTTTYMLWMQLHGFLKYHSVAVPQWRGFPVAHWFAVIRSDQEVEYIVESDFNRTGQEPVIQKL